ncbi:uncharacterized protein LOC132560032 [Ylistrum balloti]|uniref:uncharacterized protein LOC132560032 n=1 Tax=Ylistrum balloti TaxID=509963 RepID=UPI002905D4C2|nr:uncharacterized protein LOC132560032 [Ylistrum balloti]
MDSKRLRHKALRDACQAELSKQTRFLDKWQTVNEKTLSQEEETMRRQLERLQKDKARFSLENEMKEQYRGKRRFSEYDSHNEQMIRRSSFSSYLPKIADKSSFHSNEALLNQPRSHRQLKIESEALAQASQNSLQGVPKDSVTKFPKIHKHDKHHLTKERRKSMPAGHVYPRKEKQQLSEKGKKKHSTMPMIIVTDMTSSPAEDQVVLFQDDRVNSQSEALGSKHALDKNRQSSERRVSLHDQDRHDFRGSQKRLDRQQHKSNDSLARGSHQYIDHHDHVNETEELTSLYDMAIQTVASAHESAFTQVQDVHRRSIPNWKDDTKFPDAKQMDLSSLQELETMLKDARQYNTRKQREGDYGLHTAENRQQRRRLQFLEEILQALSGEHVVEFDPMEMLQCGYLRLSKSNIDRLEHMVRDLGIDPGIHAHSDVSDHDIWQELRELRQNEALEREREREQYQKEAHGRRSRQSMRRVSSDIKQQVPIHMPSSVCSDTSACCELNFTCEFLAQNSHMRRRTKISYEWTGISRMMCPIVVTEGSPYHHAAAIPYVIPQDTTIGVTFVTSTPHTQSAISMGKMESRLI